MYNININARSLAHISYLDNVISTDSCTIIENRKTKQ